MINNNEIKNLNFKLLNCDSLAQNECIPLGFLGNLLCRSILHTKNEKKKYVIDVIKGDYGVFVDIRPFVKWGKEHNFLPEKNGLHIESGLFLKLLDNLESVRNYIVTEIQKS